MVRCMNDIPGTITYRHTSTDVVCTLGIGDGATRVDEWRRLRETAGLEVEDVAGGLRLWLDAGAGREAADLARRESECCLFLDFHLASDGGRLHLDVTSPLPEAGAVIRALIGGGGPAHGLQGRCEACC